MKYTKIYEFTQIFDTKSQALEFIRKFDQENVALDRAFKINYPKPYKGGYLVSITCFYKNIYENLSEDAIMLKMNKINHLTIN